MITVWDPAKNELNKAEHKLDFADFAGFDADPVVIVDDRFDYGESRFQAFGLIGGKPHALVYTIRGAALRLISWRRAHRKEMKRYV